MDIESEKKYPEMFESCIQASVPSGWVPLVDKLCDDIYNNDPNVKVLQVKEKFGGLRFYYQGSLYEEGEVVDKLVVAAEKMSYKTCQKCGIVDNHKVETVGEGWWIKTLCEDCKQEEADGN